MSKKMSGGVQVVVLAVALGGLVGAVRYGGVGGHASGGEEQPAGCGGAQLAETAPAQAEVRLPEQERKKFEHQPGWRPDRIRRIHGLLGRIGRPRYGAVASVTQQ